MRSIALAAGLLLAGLLVFGPHEAWGSVGRFLGSLPPAVFFGSVAIAGLSLFLIEKYLQKRT